MLVLGDQGHYHGRLPWATAALVAANMLMFVAQTFIGPPLSYGYSLVPEEITTGQDVEGVRYRQLKVELPGFRDAQGHNHAQYTYKQVSIEHYPGPSPIWLTLVTSMFLHANVIHLAGNLWFLLVFGRNVECALGV